MADQLLQITDKKSGLPLGEKPLDLAEVKAKLADKNGQTYWRTLEEVANQPGFDEMLRREFPGQAPKDWAPLARRDFVKLMGASLALAGLSGCAFQPQEKIVPYVHQPEEYTPGIPLFYATAMPWMGYAVGLLAESHSGRPTKLEGNPDHPEARGGHKGALSLFGQAEIWNLYDPDRSQSVRKKGVSSSWNEFVAAVAGGVEDAREMGAAVKAAPGTVLGNAQKNGGAGLAFLTETITSPTLAAQMAAVKKALPNARWAAFEPINRDNVRQGVQIAFGTPAHPIYHFDRANVVVSLDCDFLQEEPASVRYANDFIKRRQLRSKNAADLTGGAWSMNRLYVLESTITITGAQADHRIPVKASQIDTFARALASAVGIAGVSEGGAAGDLQKWAGAISDDLKANRGRALVVAGAHQPAAVHALAHAMTAALGSTGAQGTISYHAPIEATTAAQGDSLQNLVAAMNAGKVETLVIMGGNPVFSAPGDLDFAGAMNKVDTRIHFGPSEDETSALCHWHVPQAHFLEAWGDLRGHDGTISVQQPLVQPLYAAAKAPVEFLAVFAGQGRVSSYDVVRGQYLAGGTDDLKFQKRWNKIIHDGFVEGSAAPVVDRLGSSKNPEENLTFVPVVAGNFAATLPPAQKAVGGLEINFRPDPTIWDGRYANNAWLQECPKPVSKTVWDNAAFIAPETAAEKGLSTNDRVSLTVGGKSVETAIFMLPGQPKDTITLHLGYGRERVGKIGTGAGGNANAAKLQTTKNMWFAEGDVKALGGVYKIATTAHHNLIGTITKSVDKLVAPETAKFDIDGTHGRDLVRVGNYHDLVAHLGGAEGAKLPVDVAVDRVGVPLAYPENPKNLPTSFGNGKAHSESGEHEERPLHPEREAEGRPSFYPRNADPQGLTVFRDPEAQEEEEAVSKKMGRNELAHAWGMAVDLQSCIGCNACVVGCQSENNTAIVGKDQVLMGRELHWMRIDSYHRGSYENPETFFEPMFCQHCEKAPCAPVCPFNAVMVSPEGINEQVYNRCVGTKYCENNCPYKVRRFNFLQYSDQQTPVIQLMQNPDVTVRSRGVMEKCTYCIQRVNAAKWQAEKEGRMVQDGEIVTACQQTCPTDALVFGDINDPKSRVSQLKRGMHNFGILTDHNTLPRTTYLARYKNPNPKITWDQPVEMLGEADPEENQAGTGAGNEGEQNTPVGAGEKDS